MSGFNEERRPSALIGLHKLAKELKLQNTAGKNKRWEKTDTATGGGDAGGGLEREGDTRRGLEERIKGCNQFKTHTETYIRINRERCEGSHGS